MKKYLFAALTFLLPPSVWAQTDGGTALAGQAEAEPVDTIVFPASPALTDSLDADTVALPWPVSLCQRLDELVARSRLLRTSQLGLMVYDLTADSTIFSVNARQTMRPASTMKLLTAIAAIDELGGDYQLRTSLCYTGRIADGTLQGDVYCVGGMDPAFDADDLGAFVETLRRLGVDTIRGRIVADKSMKDADRLGEGWCWDDDNPVLSPLLVGRKDQVVELLAERLRQAGVALFVETAEGATPKGANIVCRRSHSLEQILLKMMKDSDNLYAESVFYQLALAAGAYPAKAVSARGVVKKLIQRLGLNPGSYKIADGSGLSLYNYVTPELETLLLRYAWRNAAVQRLLLPVLPVAGVDGTLAKRMRGTAAAGNVRAKTGTLTCISTLAGYCQAPNGHQLCFCILNQGVLHAADGRAFQDRVCTILCEP